MNVDNPLARHIHDAISAAATDCGHSEGLRRSVHADRRVCPGCATDAVMAALGPDTLDNRRSRYVTVRAATVLIRGHEQTIPAPGGTA